MLKESHRDGLSLTHLTSLPSTLLPILLAVTLGCHSSRSSSNSPADMPPTSAESAPGGNTQQKDAPAPPVIPTMEVKGIALVRLPNQPVGLQATVRNAGPVQGTIGGTCDFKCPVVIKMVSGFVKTMPGTILKPGEEKVLQPGGGVASVCDDNRLPLQMSCTFSVNTLPSSGTGKQIEFSQTVTPP